MGAPDGQPADRTPGFEGPRPEPSTTAPRAGTASAIALWVWPTIATVGVATTSQVAGAWWAAILVIVLLAGAAANLLAMRPDRSARWAVAIAVAGAVLAVGTVILATDTIQALGSARSDAIAPSTAETSLRGKNLRGADYSASSLARTDLRGADLSGANLSGADLTDAHLNGAILRGANLQDACLRGTDMSGAILDGADFTGADTRDATIVPSGSVRPNAWPPTPSALVKCRG